MMMTSTAPSLPHHASKLHNIQLQRAADQAGVGGQLLCDTELVCGDGRLLCHAAMLAAASPAWRHLLAAAWPGTPDTLVTVLLPDLGTGTVAALLELLYTGTSPAVETSHHAEAALMEAGLLLPGVQLSVTRNTCHDVACHETRVKIEEVRDSGRNVCSEANIANRANNMEGYNKTDVTESIIKWERRNDEYDTFDDLIDGRHDEDEVIMEKIDEAVKENMCPVNVVVNMNKSFEGKADNKTCKECGKVFLYPKDLKKHMLVHLKVFPFSCKLCSKGVRTISNMYKHLRQRHSLSDNLKSYILDGQGNQFVELKEAVKKGLAEGRVDANYLIPEKVMERGSVGQNKNGVQLFKCLICDKHITKYSLKNHLSIHSGDDCFKCDVCPKTYFTNSALSNHKITNHQNQKGKQFKCSNCYRTFRSALVRDHHIQSCVQNDPDKRKTAFECRICNKMFGYKNNLVAHQKTFHGFVGKKILDYACKYCGDMIKGKLKLSKHIIAAHPEANGELCDLCGKSFKTETKLLRHIAVHKTRERNLHCSYCPKKFFRKDVLTVHEKIHTNPLVCGECGKKFPEQRYLDTHMALHGERKYKCRVCTKLFITEALLTKHEQEHHSTTLTKHDCSLCGQKFKSKAELAKHKSEHSDDYPLHCEVCTKGFLLDSQLEKHVDIVHTKASKLVLFCQHCPSDESGAEYSSLLSLKKHLNKHKCILVTKGEECDICRKDQDTYFKMKNYIKLWNTKKVIACSECDKMFKTIQELKVHSVVHTGQKPYSCNICNERFTQRSSLRTHYSRHKLGTVGCEDFSCTECGKLCKTFAALKSHSKSQHGSDVSLVSEPSLGAAAEQPGSLPQLFLQPELLSLDQLSQFQVTTINIHGLEEAVPCTMDQGVDTIAGEAGEFKIQIIDDMSSIE